MTEFGCIPVARGGVESARLGLERPRFEIVPIRGARGSIVVVEAEHMCLTMRGVQKSGSATVTNAARGLYATDEHARREAITLITPR